MSEIRKERTFDGRCTIFAGRGLIISGVSDETADRVVAQLERSQPGPRDVGGRQGDVRGTTGRAAKTGGKAGVRPGTSG